MTDSLWIFDGKGNITSYVGSYSDWRELQRDQQREQQEAAKPESNSRTESPRQQKQRLTFKEKRELEQLLPEIEALEIEKSELEAAFSSTDGTLAKDGRAAAEARRRYEEVLRLIDEKTLRWEELAARSDE